MAALPVCSSPLRYGMLPVPLVTAQRSVKSLMNRCTFILAVTLCMAEMVTYLPISSPFIRFAGRYVDEAFGFAAGWNFFVFEAAMVPFEITACNVIIHYWSDVVPAAVIIVIVILLYG